MKNAFPLAVVFAAGSLLACGQGSQTPSALLAAARDQSDIFNQAARPFVFEADLTVQLAAPMHGHLTIHWQSRNHWRRELEFGPYKETVVRVGEWEYAQRNVGFAPFRATQAVHLLEFAKQDTHIPVKGAKTRNRDGLVLTCIGLETTGWNMHSEMCTDSATHEIVSYNPWPYDGAGGSASFSSYTRIDEMKFPKHLELRVNNSPAVVVAVTKLEEQTFDTNLLTPPQGSTARRHCDDMTPAVLIQKPPDIGHLESLSGEAHVEVQVTVMKDGSVGAIQVIGLNSVELADRIRKVWMNVRFKPAMCGTEPVLVDEEVDMEVTSN